MDTARPHYLLLAESTDRLAGSGGWRFLLQAVHSDHHVRAADREAGLRPARLALMAVVRGLEALAQPSRVKLITPSAYVRRGVASGVAEWRENGWKWDRFGRLAPIRDEDLWRRVDRAMRYHTVSCRGWAGEDTRGHAAPSPVRWSSHRAGSEPALVIVRRGARRGARTPHAPAA